MYREQEYLLKAQLILAKLCLVVCGSLFHYTDHTR
jgi:hypothetical protein